jgi:uncharacterized protein involved in response to NO
MLQLIFRCLPPFPTGAAAASAAAPAPVAAAAAAASAAAAAVKVTRLVCRPNLEKTRVLLLHAATTRMMMMRPERGSTGLGCALACKKLDQATL